MSPIPARPAAATDHARLLGAIAEAVREAGEAALEVYRRHCASSVEVEAKGDGSPLTEADLLVDRLLGVALARIAPDIPVVTEERADSQAGAAPERFFLVDPVDGTKEFVRRAHEWTVNVGLIENGVPTLGVIAAPALGRLFGADPGGAWEREAAGGRRAMRVRAVPESGVECVASKSHRTPETDAFIAANGIERTVSAGSSLKFCLLASGEADIYPRFGPTMEWDTAAGDAILRAAGGSVRSLEGGAPGDPLAYGKPGWRNPHFLAVSPHCPFRMAA